MLLFAFCVILMGNTAVSELSCGEADLRTMMMLVQQLRNEYKESSDMMKKEYTNLAEEVRKLQNTYSEEIQDQVVHSKTQIANQQNQIEELGDKLNKSEKERAAEINDIRDQMNKSLIENSNRQSLLEKQYQELNESTGGTENLIKQSIPYLNTSLQEILNTVENLKDGSFEENTTPVGFSVYGAVNGTGQGTTALRFHNEHYNPGEVFNMSSGEFVCKEAGLYAFFNYILSHNFSYCWFYKNYNQTGLAGYVNSVTHSSLGTGVMLYGLKSGDKIYLSGCHGAVYIQNSSFTGFMVQSNKNV